MSESQKRVVKDLLSQVGAEELHHGDCVGADADAHDIARELNLVICVHPPIKNDLRAFCDADRLAPAKGYLSRDRDIVNETECVIATPYDTSKPAKPVGGTWYTVQYAMGAKRPVFIIFRNGDLVHVESYKNK
jgi:hypothetical protein